MNEATSSLKRLAASDCRTGSCDVCDDIAILKFKDIATGQHAGDCCVEELIMADQILDAMAPQAGLRRPTLNESTVYTR